MKKIDSLVINITDICNMQCWFCMRGDGEGKMLDLSLVPKIFEGIDEINYITITGGEPSCYPEAVTAIADYLVRHQDRIHVNGFFIITNGKIYCHELVDAVKTMLFIYLRRKFPKNKRIGHQEASPMASEFNEILYGFGVAMSIDKYHERIPLENWFKYKTSGVYSDCKEEDFTRGGVIARGRGQNILGAVYRPYQELYVEYDCGNITADTVYVTVDGHIFGDCDMSYEMETCNDPAGDLNKETLAEILERMAKENE